MVTRVAAGANLGDSLRRQVLGRAGALRLVGAVLLVLAFAGLWLDLPPLPFAFFGLGALALSRLTPMAPLNEPEAVTPVREEEMLASVDLPAVELRLGLALLPMLDSGPGGGLSRGRAGTGNLPEKVKR